MWQSIALIDWHSVGNTITGVHHNASGAARCVEREHSLNSHIHRWDIECVEHDLCHALAVGLWVHRCLGEQNWVLLRRHAELIVKGMVPDLFHVIPVSHDAMLNRIFQSEHASFGLSLVTHVAIFLIHAHHRGLMLWAAHNRWEHSLWCIITCEAGFAHAAAIVDDKS